jgi:hypothetical protein
MSKDYFKTKTRFPYRSHERLKNFSMTNSEHNAYNGGYDEGTPEMAKEFKEVKKASTTPQQWGTPPLSLDLARASLWVVTRFVRADVC